MEKRVKLGAYMLGERLARGGMGEVWTGTHEASKIPVAIKVLTEAVAREASFQELFRQEVQATARLRHPNVVSIFDYGILPEDAQEHGLEPGSPYYIMELVQGGSLKEFEWNFDALRRAILGTLSGLAHSHSRGILHLDIKPANVLWTASSGGVPRIVVTDFGLAQAQERIEGLFQISDEETTGAAGTPPYMAPEQFFGAFRDFEPSTDLYAVGIMAYEFAMGRVPFQGPTIAAYADQHIRRELPESSPRFHVPAGFRAWLERATAKSRSARFQNAAEAARALENLGEWTSSVAVCAAAQAASDTLDSSEAPTLVDASPADFWTVPREGVRVVENVEIPPDWREVTDTWVSTNWIPPGLELLKWRTPPFVGRRTERDALWAAFAQSASRRKPAAAVIRGKLGTGKSRLANWLVQTARSGGYASALTALHERSASTTHGLAGMLAERYGCLGLSGDALVERVERVLEERGIADEHESKALAQVMSSGRREAASGQSLDMTITSEARIAIVRRAILREARRGPLIVFVDDAQWGRDAVAVANQILADSTEPVALFFVMTVRDESVNDFGLEALLETFESHEGVESLELENLSRAEAREFTEEALALSGDVAELVIRSTAGNPLYATELVQHWIQTEELKSKGSSYIMSSKAPTVPESMTNLWSVAVDNLVEHLSRPRMIAEGRIAIPASEETLRARIEVAAALGVHVDLEEWERACSTLDLKAVWGLVDTWVELGVGTLRDGRFSFTHGLLRESICNESRAAGRWKAVNAAVAEALAELYEQGTPGLLARLARHYLDAGQLDETEKLLGAELERQAAFGYGANDRFQDLHFVFDRLEVDLEAPRWIDFWMLRGEQLAMSTDSRQNIEGRQMLERAVRVARDQGDQVKLGQALRFSGWCRVHGGDSQRGLREIESSVELLAGHPEESLSLTFLSLVHWYEENWEDCEETARRGLETALTPIQTYYGHQMLAYMASHHEDFEQAVFHLETCRTIADTYQMTTAQQVAHASAVDLYLEAGRYDDCLEHCEAYVEMSDLLGRSDRYSVVGLNKLGRVLALLGRFDEALPHLLRAYAVMRRLDGMPDARCADAILYCAIKTGNEQLFEEVFDEALKAPDPIAATLYIPIARETLRALKDEPRFDRYVSRAREEWSNFPEMLDMVDRAVGMRRVK